mmetsp:Transcript_40666/g.72152  ORF Transcript_40666/g.72152 Transcript_40666/m.72152 type:complete len:229 (+) Transcript_40666:216-902(+)
MPWSGDRIRGAPTDRIAALNSAKVISPLMSLSTYLKRSLGSLGSSNSSFRSSAINSTSVSTSPSPFPIALYAADGVAKRFRKKSRKIRRPSSSFASRLSCHCSNSCCPTTPFLEILEKTSLASKTAPRSLKALANVASPTGLGPPKISSKTSPKSHSGPERRRIQAARLASGSLTTGFREICATLASPPPLSLSQEWQTIEQGEFVGAAPISRCYTPQHGASATCLLP